MTAEELTRRLGGVWDGDRGTARCPAHDDKNPSLSIANKPGGGVLVHCFADCSQEKVIARLRDMRLWGGSSDDDQDAASEVKDSATRSGPRSAATITGMKSASRATAWCGGRTKASRRN